jgi:hypothetical protein
MRKTFGLITVNQNKIQCLQGKCSKVEVAAMKPKKTSSIQNNAMVLTAVAFMNVTNKLFNKYGQLQKYLDLSTEHIYRRSQSFVLLGSYVLTISSGSLRAP